MNTLRVGVSPWPRLKPECFPKRETQCDPGVELEILDTIATLANFRITLVVSNETGCGKAPTDPGSNGQWTGLLKMLQDDQIDAVGNLCNMNRMAKHEQNFFVTSWPVWQYQLQCLIQAPTPVPYFDPFAPFKVSVWLAYGLLCILFFSLIFLSHFTHSKTMAEKKQGLLGQISQIAIATTTAGSHSEFRNQSISLQILRPLWITLFASAVIFYDTYILSAVMHPFSIRRPFSNADEYVTEVLSGRYRVMSAKSIPGAPQSCSDKCQQRFDEAMKKYKPKWFPSGIDKHALQAIAEQNPADRSKLVYCDGMTFISLCFEDYPLYGRDRFWAIDLGFQQWSSYLWKKNVTMAKKLDDLLRSIGDYKYQGLSRRVRPTYGSKPHSGEKISLPSSKEPISWTQLKGYGYFSGMALSVLVFSLEVAWARRVKRKIRRVKRKINLMPMPMPKLSREMTRF